MQRGRKTPTNIVALNVQGTPPRVQPPKDLNVAERKLFVSIVGACDPKHFRDERRSDAHQLRAGDDVGT